MWRLHVGVKHRICIKWGVFMWYTQATFLLVNIQPNHTMNKISILKWFSTIDRFWLIHHLHMLIPICVAGIAVLRPSLIHARQMVMQTINGVSTLASGSVLASLRSEAPTCKVAECFASLCFHLVVRLALASLLSFFAPSWPSVIFFVV